MAKIKLSSGGFTLIPEGTYVFKITEVEYKEDFGKMSVTLQTKDGLKTTENYNFIKKNGEANEGAINVFSYFAKTALNNFSVDEIDETDLIGCYVKATVTHEEYESNKEKGKMLKAVRINDYAVASGFGSGATTEDTDEDEDLDDLSELDDLDDLDDLD